MAQVLSWAPRPWTVSGSLVWLLVLLLLAAALAVAGRDHPAQTLIPNAKNAAVAPQDAALLAALGS